MATKTINKFKKSCILLNVTKNDRNTKSKSKDSKLRSQLLFLVQFIVRCNAIIGLDIDQINQLKAPDGKSLSDHVALMIGTLGENASLRRAMVLTAAPNLYLSGYAHPSGQQKNNVLFGRIGGIVALRQCTSKDVDLSTIGKDICQHIVGMNPKRVGTSTDEPSKNSDEETCLIFQEYLNDESIKVKDYLEENGVEVIDFKRFECGECSRITGQSLEFVETCQ